MLKGETKDITASVNSDADVKTLKYTSSNSKIAKVSVNSTTGVATVTAVAEEGETDIKVESTDGSNISKKIHIVVKKPTASESVFKNQTFVGTWVGESNNNGLKTTLTIGKDGTAELEIDNYGDIVKFEFTLTSEEGKTAVFDGTLNLKVTINGSLLSVVVNNGDYIYDNEIYDYIDGNFTRRV